jgi:hypothetical protein
MTRMRSDLSRKGRRWVRGSIDFKTRIVSLWSRQGTAESSGLVCYCRAGLNPRIADFIQ